MKDVYLGYFREPRRHAWCLCYNTHLCEPLGMTKNEVDEYVKSIQCFLHKYQIRLRYDRKHQEWCFTHGKTIKSYMVHDFVEFLRNPDRIVKLFGGK